MPGMKRSGLGKGLDSLIQDKNSKNLKSSEKKDSNIKNSIKTSDTKEGGNG